MPPISPVELDDISARLAFFRDLWGDLFELSERDHSHRRGSSDAQCMTPDRARGPRNQRGWECESSTKDARPRIGSDDSRHLRRLI
jgi:hypothetical protein